MMIITMAFHMTITLKYNHEHLKIFREGTSYIL